MSGWVHTDTYMHTYVHTYVQVRTVRIHINLQHLGLQVIHVYVLEFCITMESYELLYRIEACRSRRS